MAVTAGQVKELRERTGLGMMECKKALVETDGDIELAIENLRKSGQAKAAKKAGRIAAEGAVIAKVSADGKTAILLEVNSETDFVARDANFTGFASKVADRVLASRQTDIAKLLAFAQKEKIDLTLPLSDDPLALGIVDEFQKADLRIWGPTQAAAKIEWSKAYAKEYMKNFGIPTARYATFSNFESASAYIQKEMYPLVIKADGLALGKGVTIAENRGEAEEILRKIFVAKIFGDAGKEVVIEEYLSGIEISAHVFSDGKNYQLFPLSQDHKRILDGNTGPNTGGMGTVAPLSFVSAGNLERIEQEIITPAIRGLARAGTPFTGVLYPGIMLTPDGPKVFEFNARFGDPEAQSYMRLLATDPIDIIDACLGGFLDKISIEWHGGSACTIALASFGYPGNYEKDKSIAGIKDAELDQEVVVFHAGTKIENGKLVTNGAGVLGVSATGESLQRALATAYTAIKKINFEGMQYRKDIGKMALEMLN